MLSRWFPAKRMLTGEVGRPVSHIQINRKIYLDRVSKQKFIQKCTSHTRFCDDALI